MNPQYQKMLKQVQDMQKKPWPRPRKSLPWRPSRPAPAAARSRSSSRARSRCARSRIDPDAVDPDDVEMLQDLVTAATNEALRAAQALAQQKLGGATAGVDLPNIPGLF